MERLGKKLHWWEVSMRSTRICAPQLTVLIMAVIAVTVFAASARPAFTQSTGPSWSYTGSLNTPRYGHTATLLPNGKVLVVGGASGADLLDSAELYDPATGTWSLTGHLNVAHWFHTATLLPNGKVLVAGGQATNGYPFFAAHTAEIYDPATGTWSLTGNLNVPRLFHTATLLPNR